MVEIILPRVYAIYERFTVEMEKTKEMVEGGLGYGAFSMGRSTWFDENVAQKDSEMLMIPLMKNLQ